MPLEPKPNLLFLDDEPNILQGLERTLRPMRRKWNMSFVLNGSEALKLAQKEPCHILVTDLCMPEMSGIYVLRRFRDIYPNTIRIVLSGQTDRDTFWEAIGLAHVYVGKPCESQVLEAIITRALDAKHHLPHPGLRRLVSQIEFVPFFPDNWQALVEESESASPNMEKIAAIIYQDIGMSAKVLQIASSAYLGTPHLFTSSKKAALSLSIEGINAMVRYYKSLLPEKDFHLPTKLFDAVRQRCLISGLIAKRIVKEQNKSVEWQEKAFLVGLLHGLGEIILIYYFSSEYREALNLSNRKNIPLWKAEREIFKCTHEEISVFLLSIWGLPTDICNALAFHHMPLESGQSEFGLLTAAHVAEVLAGQLVPPGNAGIAPCIDMEYLSKIGHVDSLTAWRELSIALFNEMESLTRE